MENENSNKENNLHEQNQKKIEYYINRIQNLNDNGEEVKMVIEDSFENQEKEYEENITKRKKKRRMSLVPLYIILILGFNLLIYNKYGDDNIFIPFITFAISIYIIYKYVPQKAKIKFIKDFEETMKSISNLFLLFKNDDRENKLKKYIAVSSDDQNKLLKDEDKEDNCIDSPLLNI